MMAADENYRQRTADWFASLRDRICAEFEMIEDEFAANSPGGPSARFDRRDWQRPGGGGGAMAIMKGRVFEKVGVNVSVVHGEFALESRNKFPAQRRTRVSGLRTSRWYRTRAHHWFRRRI
jgi:coproporphyrinogen III oxidase